MFVRNPSAFEKAFDEFHTLKYLLFLEASPNDLHAKGKTMHVISVVALVCIRFNLVSWSEHRREDVKIAVHARDGHDARRVVKLESSQRPSRSDGKDGDDTHNVEQERIPTRLPLIPAVPMSHRWERVRHGQHEVEFLLLPVLEPPHAVVLTLADERVKLLSVLRVPPLDNGSVDRVAEDVAIEPGAGLHEDPG